MLHFKFENRVMYRSLLMMKQIFHIWVHSAQLCENYLKKLNLACPSSTTMMSTEWNY